MSSAPPPSNPPPNPEKKSDPVASDASAPIETSAMDVTDDTPPEETWDDISEDILALSTDEILTRARLIDNDIKVILPSVVFSFPNAKSLTPRLCDRKRYGYNTNRTS
jgi:26S proteasome regulatory subunit T5